MPKIENTSANVQEMLKKDGTVDQITKKLANILNGNLIVKKAEQDANGSNIVDTYATKDEFNDRGIQIVNLDSNGSTFIEQYEVLNDIVVSGIYKINITGSDNLIGWLIVAPHNNALFQILIDYMSTIRYRTKDAPTLNWNNWESFATYQQLQDKESDIMYQVTNNLTAIVETFTLTTTNIGSLTVSSELNNLRDNKIYKIKCGSKYGWLFVTQRELETKNTIQTIIDFDGSIYHRYRYIADITSEDRWSDWVLIPDSDFLNEILEGLFDERGIRQPSPIPSYDELTEHGVYSLNNGLVDNEYVFSVHSPVSSAEITQYRFNSEEGLLKRTYSQNMETGEKSWSDWIKYISTEEIDTALSETSTNPVQNKVVTEAFKSRGIQLYGIDLDLSDNRDVNFTNRQELNSIGLPGIYKLYFYTSDTPFTGETAWLIVCDNNSGSLNTSQTLINMDGTMYIRHRGADYGDDPYAWSEWIEYATQKDIKSKISMWKPNTHYDVDDTVIALDPDGYYYTATCKTGHISSDIDSMFMGDTSYWTIKNISSKQSFSAIYATDAGRSTQAEEDADGNIITATYATKAELRPTPITDISSTIVANKSYNYGKQTELSIAFPAVANDGDVVYITFTSGATATVLTIDTTNTSDIELIPEANTGYEIYAKYNGTIWIVNYSDYTVTAEAGA